MFSKVLMQGLWFCFLSAAVEASAAPAARSSAASSIPPSSSAPDSVALKGGTPGTVLDDMTIEGEDRIRIEFERPDLHLDVDPKSAPGLDGDHSLEVLDRSAPRAEPPLLARSALDRTERLARPWFNRFSTGPVARFQPKIEGAATWKLTVADSRGHTVASFEDMGKAPGEIAWDGAGTAGGQAMPGLVYSYVFEAYDRAGNKRSFNGEGFEVRPYVRKVAGNVTLFFAGHEIADEPHGVISPILLECASWLNQIENLSSPVRVEARAQSLDQATALAERAAAGIGAVLLGDPARLQTFTVVEPDAPEGGTLVIAAKK